MVGPGTNEEKARRFTPRRRVCAFCANKVDHVDYKETEILRNFVTDRGKIKPRRKSGLCARHQRRLARAVKQARRLALLPMAPDHVLP